MDSRHQPQVSVVVPTTLRRDIISTIQSARAQTVPVELVLVVDREQAVFVPPAVEALVDEIVFTGGSQGAAHARNCGVAASSCEWIAYLDDDDEWLPEKLARQLAVHSALPEPTKVVVSCRVKQRTPESERLSPPVPARTFVHGHMSIGDYLFRRRGPSVTRNSVFLPTLLVHRDLAKRVLWDESLRRHQDWDWLLRAEASGAKLVQLDDILALITVGSPGSISASADWRTSLTWARNHRHLLSQSAYADFLAGQTLRFALGSRELRGISQVALEIARTGMPSLPSLALGVAGAIPRKLLEYAAFALTRIRGRAGA